MHVAELWRYPVKGLGGERIAGVTIERDGIPGDRAVHLRGPTGSVVTARTLAELVTVSAALDDEGLPTIDGHPWDGHAARARIAEVAGEGVVPVASSEGHLFDDTPLLVATDGAVEALGADRRRFRPNLVVGGVEGLAERDWPGRGLRAGSALLEVEKLCARCAVVTVDPDSGSRDPSVLRRINEELAGTFALNCRVAEPGTMSAGDPVEIH